MSYYRGDVIGFRGDYYRGDYYRGDPGLFSFLGKALGGVAKIATGFLKGQLGLPTGSLGGTGIVPISPFGGPGSGIFTRPTDQGTGVVCPPGTACKGASSDGLCIGSCVPLPGGMPTGMMGAACQRGFHMNKSRYVTRGGGTSHWPPGLLLHERGTTCVKTRRMNVGNARALRRSLRRISGFAKLVKRSRRAVARAASAVGVHQRGKKGKGGAPSVRIVKAA
jgi:hypothetical protein